MPDPSNPATARTWRWFDSLQAAKGSNLSGQITVFGDTRFRIASIGEHRIAIPDLAVSTFAFGARESYHLRKCP